MEVQYKRNFNESYMVIETEEMCSDYEEQMTRQNQIRCLLSFYTMEVNNRMQYWYQVTGKESLAEYLKREGVSIQILEKIFCGLSEACDEIRKYLLKQERICLTPETVYLSEEKERLQLYLCYCPLQMEDIYLQFQGVMEHILTLLEEDQGEEAKLCYRLYDITLKQNYHFSQLLACVQEETGSLDTAEAPLSDEMQVDEMKILEPELSIPMEEECLYEKEEAVCSQKKTGKPILIKIQEKVKKEMETVRELIPMLAAGDSRAGKETRSRLQYQGNKDEQDYLIDKKVFLIGNYMEDNDACLHSPTVSRSHARIFYMEKKYYLEDMGSANGTYLNGERLERRQQRPLNTLDQIRFGEVDYIFYE